VRYVAVELALAKPVGVSKKFCLLDVAALSHARATSAVTTRTARVAFDNLGDDSSPDVHEAPSPETTMEKHVSPLPSVSGEFLRFSSTILTVGPDDFLLQTCPACILARVVAGEPRCATRLPT
jgi:hypothetical protein